MIGIGIIATLFLVALIVFVTTFDLNNYKDRISQAVYDQTGRTLHFTGDLNLTLFPILGVKLGSLSLSNAEGFGQKPMVQVASAHVSVQVIPLLRGNIEFHHLQLDHLSLDLSRDKNGKTNWDDLVGRPETDDTKKPATPNDTSFSLKVQGITIKDADLNWDDQMRGSTYILRGINLETGQIHHGAPFPITANLDFECTNPDVKGSISLSGKSAIDFENRLYSHMDTRLEIMAEGDDIPGAKAKAELAWKLFVLDFKKEHAQITDLAASAYGASLQLNGTLDGLTDGVNKAAGTVAVAPFNLKETLLDMGKEAPTTGSPDALTQVAATIDFNFKPGRIQIKSLSANLDGSTITGNGHVKQSEDVPAYFARLDIDTLDLDKYLPPKHADKATTATVEAGDTDKVILESAILRQLSLDIEAKIGSLKIANANFQNVKGEVKARHGLVRISPISADCYGGTISMGATINALRKYPKTDIIVGIEKVDVGALSKDVTNNGSYGGIIHLNSALSCEGESATAMLKTTNGKISFNLKDGIFPGVDLMRMAKATHKKTNATNGTVEAVESDSTKFGSIAGTGIITNGVLRNRDLEVKAPGYRADGEGSIVLPTQRLDYLLKVKLTPTAGGQDGKSSDDLYGVMVPIRVAGTLEHPHYWVSIPEYVKALGGAVLGTAGAVLGGVTKAIKGVGAAISGSDESKKEKSDETPEKRKKFLGIF